VRILFVENHAEFAKTVKREFLSDHEVLIVPTISGARIQASTHTFDAVLVDYDLDDGKGAEFVRWLVQLPFRGLIVAVSSHESGNAALVAAGAAATCPKTKFSTIGEVLAHGRCAP
jgi:DNA-binding response OmpR family regulator